MQTTETHHQIVPIDWSGARLDQAAANLFPDYSRSRLQAWIAEGALRVDDRTVKAKTKLVGGERLSLTVVLQSEGDWVAQNLALDVVHEDDHVIVINKPANLVVHPAAGNPDGTLLNGLLYHFPDLRELPRAGIVHRLDKDTTGLMVVAKSLKAHHSLVAQLQARSVERQYVAIVQGSPPAEGTIDEPIGRHPRQRQKMAVVHSNSKEAITHFRVAERFRHFASMTLKLSTGRTHQIRVHMAHLGYPLIGDPLYGSKMRKVQGMDPDLESALTTFDRQALHAERLSLIHPETEERCTWQRELPVDMSNLLATLRRHDPQA
ncbi:23S rRNA pseudouridine(1911/1915/1917) synthase RluD [Aurantivibrio plasticivorans]